MRWRRKLVWPASFRDSRLKRKQFAVLAGNVSRLQRNLAKDTEPGPLLDYTAVSPEAYTNLAGL